MADEDSTDAEKGIFFSAGLNVPFDKLVGLVVDTGSLYHNQIGLIVAKDVCMYRLKLLNGIEKRFRGLNEPFCHLSAEVSPRRQIEVYSREMGSGFYMALMRELGRSPINLLARVTEQSTDGSKREEYFGKQLRALGEMLRENE